MPVRIGTGVSTQADVRVGAIEAAAQAREGLGGHADLAMVFASGAHLEAAEATLEGVHEALMPTHVVGCGAGGLLAGARELEAGTGVVVWTAAFEEGEVEPFHAVAVGTDDDQPVIDGLPEGDGSTAVILLPDPYSFPTDRALALLQEQAPGMPVLEGLASARTPEGSSALFLGREVIAEGAVGVAVRGLEVLPCVSQGAAPIGPELTITAGEGHIVRELAGAPALAKIREVVSGLGPRERALVAQGLLVGLVIDGGKPEYRPGDFLVRGVLGADPNTGAIAVGAEVRPGQVVRLHARDADSADRELREALALRMSALGGREPAGALCFTCNGRGRDMFGRPDHDAGALQRELQGAPAAGFFAAGEIGPVGGESFLHGFTATVAIFA